MYKCLILSAIILTLNMAFLQSCSVNAPKREITLHASRHSKNQLEYFPVLPDTASIHQLIRNGADIAAKYHNTDSSIASYSKALELSQQINYTEGNAIAYYSLSALFIRKNDYQSSSYFESQYENELNKLPSKFYNPNLKKHRDLIIARDVLKIQKLYFRGEFDTAYAFCIKLMPKIEKEEPDSFNYSYINSAYYIMGSICDNFSDSIRSIYYFNQALEISLKYNNYRGVVQALDNKAAFYSNRKNAEQGILLAKRALNIARDSIKDKRLESLSAYQIAACLLNLNNPTGALYYSNLTLQLRQEVHDKKELISAYILLGANYNQLQKYHQAKAVLLAAKDSMATVDQAPSLATFYEELTKTYEGLGNAVEALKYHKQYTIIHDSLRNSENASRIAIIDAKYRVSQKEKSLLQADIQLMKQRQKHYYWIAGTLICVSTLLGFIFYKQRKAAREKLKAMLDGEEKERLRMAKELHDGIVSSLSVIKTGFSSFIHQQTEEDNTAFQETLHQLDQSIEEIRTTSHNLLPDTIRYMDLTKAVENYCVKISKVYGLDVSFQLIGEQLPELSDEFRLNVYRIIQELLQNIIKHAQATHALVQFMVTAPGSSLEITIDDNGTQQLQYMYSKQGIGYHNIQSRIQLLNGTINTEWNKGSSFYLSFPLKNFIVRA